MKQEVSERLIWGLSLMAVPTAVLASEFVKLHTPSIGMWLGGFMWAVGLVLVGRGADELAKPAKAERRSR